MVTKPPKKSTKARGREPAEEADEMPVGGQEHFPGMEPQPKNEKIHRLAKRTRVASRACSTAKSEWQGLKEQLIEAMIEADLSVYEYGDVSVHLDTKRQLKVKISNEDEE